MLRYLNHAINTGVHPGLPIIESRRIRMLNILTLICIPVVVLFLAINIIQNRSLLVALNLANFVSLLLFFLMHRYRLYHSAKLIRISFSIIIYTVSGLFYHNGAEYSLIGTLVIAVLVFDKKWLIGILSILIVTAILVVLNFNIGIPGEAQISASRIYIVVIFSLLLIIVSVGFFKHIQSDYQREIEAKQQNLIIMNKDKEQLFSIVSHDIRGPLLSLEKTLDMYRSGLLEREDMSAATESLHKTVSHLNNTVDVLLRWSSSGMSGIRTTPDHFPLINLVNEVVLFFEFMLQQKEISVRINVPESIILFADSDQVAVVLRNLLGNALKFSYTGGGGEIIAEEAEKGGGIYLKNEGKGMDEDARSKLFSMRQNPAYGTNGERGSGLGLLLSKEFITNNNGNIYVESSPGKGTCFTLLFQNGERDNRNIRK